MKNKSPRILFLDIETCPIISYTWGIWDQNVPLNMIKQDWHLLSFAAKWLGDKDSQIIYYDQRNEKDITNDKKLLEKVWKLLDECDILVTQNGKSFDEKKLNARFIINDMKPPASYRSIDTKRIATKKFAFTSNKLEYMSDKLNKKFRKLKHEKFPGFELWKECMKGNKHAFNELKKYNIYDILTLEELYNKLAAWDTTINFNVYREENDHVCSCGSKEHKLNGYRYTSLGKFRRYKCKKCGKEGQSSVNLLSKEKRQSLRR